MIQVKNLNKYFNKNKSNEIHVINDTNITFPKTGLVCLLGPSGCGKTSLLNVIGGLDKANSGEIIIDDIKIKKYNARKVDQIRNRHFGYIFQNYILLPDLTVYQNLEFVLKMFKLSQEEIDERIDYALNAVGMLKYKKRKTKQLSGGQQQRVVIARALVKSPNIVIADEPTGNLDEKNTTQIMNIIKKISKECLVVLVTHEKRIANFYADEIIELKDGQVFRQFKVTEKEDLQHLEDTNIYLKEFEKGYVSSDVNIEYFYKDKNPDINLKVIISDNNVYIYSDQDNLKIKLVDKNSETQVYDTLKPVIKQETVEEFEYKLPKISNNVKNISALSFKDILKMSINNLGSLKKRQKILFFLFFLTAILVVISVSNYLSATHVEEKDFLVDNRNIVNIDYFQNEKLTLNQMKNNIGSDIILAPYNSLILRRFNFDIFIQGRGGLKLPNNSILPIDVLEDKNLYMGRLPEKIGEIVIDKWIIDTMLNDINYVSYGISSYQQIIGSKYSDRDLNISGEIVGIVDTNNPNIYSTIEEYQLAYIKYANKNIDFITEEMNKSKYYFRLEDYKANPSTKKKQPIDELTLKSNEALVSKSYLKFVSDYVTFGRRDYKIVGVYETNGTDDYVISKDGLEELMFDYLLINNNAAVYTLDKEATIAKIRGAGYVPTDVYKAEYEKNYTVNLNYNLYIISVIIMLASFIFLYFIMRSSLISRVYEIGVYRALGVSRSNIFKMFAFEIFIITLITAGLGLIFTTYALNEAKLVIPFIYFPWYISFVTLGFLLVANILIGLAPIINLLRLTPSQILSKYDI